MKLLKELILKSLDVALDNIKPDAITISVNCIMLDVIVPQETRSDIRINLELKYDVLDITFFDGGDSAMLRTKVSKDIKKLFAEVLSKMTNKALEEMDN